MKAKSSVRGARDVVHEKCEARLSEQRYSEGNEAIYAVCG